MTYHSVTRPTSDHRLVLMTTCLTSADGQSFINAPTGTCGKSEPPCRRNNAYSPGKIPQWTQYHALMRSSRRWCSPSFGRGSAPSGPASKPTLVAQIKVNMINF